MFWNFTGMFVSHRFVQQIFHCELRGYEREKKFFTCITKEAEKIMVNLEFVSKPSSDFRAGVEANEEEKQNTTTGQVIIKLSPDYLRNDN